MNGTSTSKIILRINLGLEAYRSKVYNIPVSQNELERIELRLGYPSPTWFREFLLQFGIRQDLIFGLATTPDYLVELQDGLPEKFANQYMVVGDNGGEEYWLINKMDENDHLVYEWQFWNNSDVVPIAYTFEELIDQSFLRLKEYFDVRLSNHEKHWQVEFLIRAQTDEIILNALNAFRITNWENTGISSAQVRGSRCFILIGGQKNELTKSEYFDWDLPLYSFSMKEAFADVLENSKIREIDEKLKNGIPTYKIVDYGIY